MVVRPFQSILDLALQYAGSIEASFDINPEITAKPLEVNLSLPTVINKKVVDSYASNQVYPATLGVSEEAWTVEFEPDYSVGRGDIQFDSTADYPYIIAQPDAMTVDKFANTYFSNILSNRAYTVSSNVSWIDVISDNQFDSRLSIYVALNSTNQPRSGVITLSAIDNSSQIQINLLQNG